MQAKQSFQCHPVKSDPDSKSKNNIKPDNFLIDLSKTYEERRDERKSGKVIRRTDEVFLWTYLAQLITISFWRSISILKLN